MMDEEPPAEERGMMDEEPPAEEGMIDEANPIHPANWINKRYSEDPKLGLHGYIKANLEAFLAAPDAILDQLRKKYDQIYTSQERPVQFPFPLAPVIKGTGETKQVEPKTEVEPKVNGKEEPDDIMLEKAQLRAELKNLAKLHPKEWTWVRKNETHEGYISNALDNWEVDQLVAVIDDIRWQVSQQKEFEEKF
jgi:hypothetical protein